MNENELLEELGKYLESKGWKPLVIGFKGIAQRERKYNYSLIVDFTGKKIEKDAQPSEDAPNSPQTNQTVEQERGDISTLDTSTIAHDVGKVKTADTSKSKDVYECECEHDDNCHENTWGICNVVGCQCTKFSKKSKSEYDKAIEDVLEILEKGHKTSRQFKTIIPRVRDLKKSKSESNHSPKEKPCKNATERKMASSALEDTSESKESKIADELNKDYPNIKDYPNEDPSDFCKKCGTMLIYSKQEKVFICPKCVKTKQSESEGKD